MPAIDLSNLPNIPYVYSGSTPATVNTCQLIIVPNRPGVVLTIHNRSKATKELRMSFDPTLTQGGAAPATWFTIDVSHEIYIDGAAWSGFTGNYTMAFFSDSASVIYELLFSSAVR